MMTRLVTCFGLFLLAGCAGPVGLYHDVEGGAIAQARQPPPGADLPYPNLASVPPARLALTPERLVPMSGGVSAPAPGALAGLTLPSAPPPVPEIPGFVIPAGSAPPPAAMAAPIAAEASPPPGAPVQLAFTPGSAVLTERASKALFAVALGRAQARVVAGGFGEAAMPGDAAALRLAVARARRIADALTAAGVPGSDIRMVAAAAGSGGFVQLVY